MNDVDLAPLCREAVLLHRTAKPDIRWQFTVPTVPVRLRCDSGMLTQALTNLLKNAAEAIEARLPRSDGAPLPQGRVAIRIVEDSSGVGIVVEDNGAGLPAAERSRLTEPYVTTRLKGTGLGLAIVKKIMEDHSGDLILEARKGGGARVRLVFPAQGSTNVDGASNNSAAHGA
jgi:two-component system nitrogen regulation sensor histidine kinase NtrY